MKRTVILLAVLALLPGALLAAQRPAGAAGAPADPTAPTTAGQPANARDLAQDFVPVSALPPPAEQLPAAPLLIGAYAVVWVALLVYVWLLWKRLTKLERELVDLQRRVQRQ